MTGKSQGTVAHPLFFPNRGRFENLYSCLDPSENKAPANARAPWCEKKRQTWPSTGDQQNPCDKKPVGCHFSLLCEADRAMLLIQLYLVMCSKSEGGVPGEMMKKLSKYACISEKYMSFVVRHVQLTRSQRSASRFSFSPC